MKKLFTLNNLTSLRVDLSTGFFYFTILIFLIGFNFTDTPPPSGWYQQFMPNIGGRQIKDITFLDSLTGYAVTNNLAPTDTGYVLKTTNGGDNWIINLVINRNFTTVKFINNNTGFICGGSGGGTAYLYKTVNSGLNWNLVTTPGATSWRDMSVLNQDTLWLVDSDGLVGGVFRTTNGGSNWTPQLNLGSSNPSKIYMFNFNIGFISDDLGSYLRNTTNGGTNWNPVIGSDGFSDMYFIDNLTGWKSRGNMKKTTDGGLNWVTQILPGGGVILIKSMLKFSNVNKDTIWGVGGDVFLSGNRYRGIIYRTINGGTNWGFQLPDTSIALDIYYFVKFTNKLNGWSYTLNTKGVHTVTGGDTITYTGLDNKMRTIPEQFVLKQNYPNPFNPNTIIEYELKSAGEIKLTVFDVTGKKISTLTDQRQVPGTYSVNFSGKGLSSGVYFYRLEVHGISPGAGQVFSDTKKMLLVK